MCIISLVLALSSGVVAALQSDDADLQFLKRQSLLKRHLVSATRRINTLATPDMSEKEQRQLFWSQMLGVEYSPTIKTVAELGVQSGKFSQALLGNVSTISRYYMVDPWKHLKEWNKPANYDDNKQEEIYTEAMAAVSLYKSRTTVLRGSTLEMRDNVADDSLDFLYIDGDHTAGGVVIDMLYWALRKSKMGSIVGGDDYIDNPNIHGSRYEFSAVVQTLQVFSKLFRFRVFKLPNHQFAFIRPPVTQQILNRVNATMIEREVQVLLARYDSRGNKTAKKRGSGNGSGSGLKSDNMLD